MLQNISLRLPLQLREADNQAYHRVTQPIALPLWPNLISLPIDLVEENFFLPGRFNRGIETQQEILQGLPPATNESGKLLILVYRDSGAADGSDPAEGDLSVTFDQETDVLQSHRSTFHVTRAR